MNLQTKDLLEHLGTVFCASCSKPIKTGLVCKACFITDLTPEQHAAMKPHADAWIARALEVRPADRTKAERGIRAYYRIAGLSEPNKIIWTTSPLAVVLAGSIAANILKTGTAVCGAVHDVATAVDNAVGTAVRGAVDVAVDVAVGTAVHDAVGTAVRVAVGTVVHDAVSSAVDGAVHDVSGAVDGAMDGAVDVAVDVAVRDAVSDAMDGAVHDAVSGAVSGAVHDVVDGAVDGAVGSAVDGAVSDAVHDAVKENWYRYLGGQFWSAWPAAYATFFRDRCNFKLIPEVIQAAEDVTECGWWWPHSDFVIVCDRPVVLEQNPLKIIWSDRWSVEK